MTAEPQEKPFDAEAEIRTDMTIEDYHKDKTLSKSKLVEIECPAKFDWLYNQGGADQEEDHLNIGNAVHTLALEPELFAQRFHVLPEGLRRDPRTKDYKAELALAGKRTVLTYKDHLDIIGMAKSLTSNKKAMALLKAPGKIEQTIFWTDERTGIRLKTRPDLWRDDGLLVNVKTCASAEPDAFDRSAWDFHYDIGCAMECLAVKAATGKMPDNYALVGIEKKPPYIVEVRDCFRVDAKDIGGISYFDAGVYRLEKLLDKYLECATSGIWPSYTKVITPMKVPKWGQYKIEKGE